MPTKSLSLPTLSAFKKLSARRRGLLFLDWVRTQKGAYNFCDHVECPLGQFGKALMRGKYAHGVVYGFVSNYEEDAKNYDLSHILSNWPSHVAVVPSAGSFGVVNRYNENTYEKLAVRLAVFLNGYQG